MGCESVRGHFPHQTCLLWQYFKRLHQGGNIIIFSVTDLVKGSELTIDYLGTGAVPVATRRMTLLHAYGFHYICWACLSNRTISWAFLLGKKKLVKPEQLANSEIFGGTTAEELAVVEKVRQCYERLIFNFQQVVAIVELYSSKTFEQTLTIEACIMLVSRGLSRTS